MSRLKRPCTHALQIDLHGPVEAERSNRGAPILTLPTELHSEIISYLHPVDRVCLGLTCKSLAFSVLTSPRLRPTNWSWFSDRPHIDWVLPSSYSLILRLAHGWIPKDKLRYCWKCHKILPRDETYFRRRLGCKKKPRWSLRTGLSEEEWSGMSKKERYSHLIEMWCHADTEDSSYLYCDYCRQEIAESKHVNHLVHCPICLEKELTWAWRPPRTAQIRRWLWNAARPVLQPICKLGSYLLIFCGYAFQIVVDQVRRRRLSLCW